MRALRAGEKSVRMVNRSGQAEVPPDVEIVAADVTDRPSARRHGAAIRATLDWYRGLLRAG